MPLRRILGSITVTALTDGEGPFFQPRAEAFPDATAAHWHEADRRDPASVTADGRWWLPFRSFALRRGDGPVTLVDAGIGPADSPAASWAPVPGRLPAELAAAGIDPADVDTVVLTHLHSDHIGWAVTGTPGRPYFPRADYLVQRAELAAMETINPWLPAGLVAPLRAAGRLRVVDGDTPLAPGVRLLSTPGHTPGHQSVLVDSGDERLLLTGDLLVHAVQMVDPDLAYAHEEDPATA
ncbi:MBL fold metallo-hydrolase, partial [Micromonospora sp. NPDC050200]|uniref:MBL fold metallo-hydrolase n=1 Tax=Micromonospora sp. NPDC050200 TaxID=3155664 RepID=UPI0033C6B299